MSGRGWSPDAEEAPPNHADWADDPSKPTPAQRAAAIADKAVDEITNSGYHYWHNTVPKGEGAAPAPVPIALASGAAAVTRPVADISAFSFLEEDDVIKLYIALEGDLEDVTEAQVEARFERPQYSDDFVMEVTVHGKLRDHRLKADKLAGPIDCEKCKTRVLLKKKKLIVTLTKLHPVNWGQLRANVCLPYRRGGAN